MVGCRGPVNPKTKVSLGVYNYYCKFILLNWTTLAVVLMHVAVRHGPEEEVDVP